MHVIICFEAHHQRTSKAILKQYYIIKFIEKYKLISNDKSPLNYFLKNSNGFENIEETLSENINIDSVTNKYNQEVIKNLINENIIQKQILNAPERPIDYKRTLDKNRLKKEKINKILDNQILKKLDLLQKRHYVLS